MITQLTNYAPSSFNLAICGIGNAGRAALDTYRIYRGDSIGINFTMFDFPWDDTDYEPPAPTQDAVLGDCDCLITLVDFSEKQAVQDVRRLTDQLTDSQRKPDQIFFVTLSKFATDSHVQDTLSDRYKCIFVEKPSQLCAPIDILISFTGSNRGCIGVDAADLFATLNAHNRFYLTQLQQPSTEQLLASHTAFLEKLQAKRTQFALDFTGIVILGTFGHMVTLDDFETVVFQEIEYWDLRGDDRLFQLNFNADETDERATLTVLFCIN